MERVLGRLLEDVPPEHEDEVEDGPEHDMFGVLVETWLGCWAVSAAGYVCLSLSAGGSYLFPST
jgi:hypothetical protein